MSNVLNGSKRVEHNIKQRKGQNEGGLKMTGGAGGERGTLPTVGASFVQEVAEVEQGVSRCQELQESLQEGTRAQGLVPFL